MQAKRLVVLAVLFITATAISNAYAYTECTREVHYVWIRMTENQSVHITFKDGSAIYKHRSQVSEGQLNRLFSMAIAAQASGKKLRVRYPEDALSCPPVGDARNDFEGIWLLDN